MKQGSAIVLVGDIFKFAVPDAMAREETGLRLLSVGAGTRLKKLENALEKVCPNVERDELIVEATVSDWWPTLVLAKDGSNSIL